MHLIEKLAVETSSSACVAREGMTRRRLSKNSLLSVEIPEPLTPEDDPEHDIQWLVEKMHFDTECDDTACSSALL